MEHISTIVQEALDRAADQVERNAPLVAEQIREASEQIVEFPVERNFLELRLVS